MYIYNCKKKNQYNHLHIHITYEPLQAVRKVETTTANTYGNKSIHTSKPQATLTPLRSAVQTAHNMLQITATEVKTCFKCFDAEKTYTKPVSF